MQASPLPQPYITTRSDVVKELYESEIAFLATMSYVVDTLQPGLAAIKGVPENHALCETIFGGIPQIRRLSQKLCILFEGAIRAKPEDPFISEVFLQTSNEFVCFSQYISNQPQAVKAYHEAISDQRAMDGMKVLLASKQAQSRSPEDLFAIAFQRICRYGLFLDRLIKVTPSTHLEREGLLLASRKMQETVGLVNSLRGAQDRKVKLIAINEMIEFSGDYPPFDIIVPNREIIYHGPLHKIRTFFNRPLYFFIFNDIIIYTSEQKSIFRDTRYSVQGVMKIDQYFKVTRHDKASESRHYISIFETIKHLGKHYDALNAQNMQQVLNAFDEACTRFAIQFIQSQAKQRLDDKLKHDRAICALCPRALSRFGRNTCGLCHAQVCSDCFSCQFSHKQCCKKCGEERGIIAINPRLLPQSRSYKCINSYNPRTARMIEITPGDKLEVYCTINQRWGVGKNITTGLVGTFPLSCCTLDLTEDLGEHQNLALFCAIFEPLHKPGAKNNFPISLNVGDVLAITWDNSDGWYYAYSLQTEKFGYVHYTDLIIVKNTEILKRKYH